MARKVKNHSSLNELLRCCHRANINFYLWDLDDKKGLMALL